MDSDRFKVGQGPFDSPERGAYNRGLKPSSGGAEMQQRKISLTPSLAEFLDDHRSYGFKDKSLMVRSALLRFQEELELESLSRSADLYAELCEEEECRELTESALQGWPE